MPYKSAKQSRFLHSQKPEVAAKFDADIKKVALKKMKYKAPKARC